jgi:hypothetical protein
MPIPKWCDRKSIRTVKSGKARVLVCCPKKKWKAGRCTVGTRAIDVKVRGFGAVKLTPVVKGTHRTFVGKAGKIDYFVQRDVIDGRWYVSARIGGQSRPIGGSPFATKAAATRAVNDHEKFYTKHFGG